VIYLGTPYVEFLDEGNDLNELLSILNRRVSSIERSAKNLIRELRRARETPSTAVSENDVLRIVSMNPRDPPCAICGKMTDDIVCPECRARFKRFFE